MPHNTDPLFYHFNIKSCAKAKQGNVLACIAKFYKFTRYMKDKAMGSRKLYF